MMHEKRIRTIGTLSIGAIMGVIAACAGSAIPETDEDTLQRIAAAYAGASAVAVGGSGGTPAAGGTGGTSANGGSQSTDNGGSSGDSGSGGSAVSAGGSAGSAGSSSEGGSAGSAAGAGGGDGCDGFAVLATNCGSSGCHGEGGPFNPFAASEDAAAALEGENGSVSCAGAGPLFNAANPEASIVVQKMRGTATCGTPMPPPSGGVSDEDIACVVEWISSL